MLCYQYRLFTTTYVTSIDYYSDFMKVIVERVPLSPKQEEIYIPVNFHVFLPKHLQKITENT